MSRFRRVARDVSDKPHIIEKVKLPLTQISQDTYGTIEEDEKERKICVRPKTEQRNDPQN